MLEDTSRRNDDPIVKSFTSSNGRRVDLKLKSTIVPFFKYFLLGGGTVESALDTCVDAVAEAEKLIAGGKSQKIKKQKAPAAREPSAEYLAAAGKVRKATGEMLLFDSIKTRDGRAIGDVVYGELSSLIVANEFESKIYKWILNHCKAPFDTKIRDTVKHSVFKKAIEEMKS